MGPDNHDFFFMGHYDDERVRHRPQHQVGYIACMRLDTECDSDDLDLRVIHGIIHKATDVHGVVGDAVLPCDPLYIVLQPAFLVRREVGVLVQCLLIDLVTGNCPVRKMEESEHGVT